MPSGSYFTTSSILAFIALGLIRGSFSVVIHFADFTYKSPSLVFLLRTPGTVILYGFFMVFLASRSHEHKQVFLQNFRNVSNYWKSAVMGFVQLAAPYLLFMYGLKILPPTAGGVFMAAAPWTTALLERLPFIQHKSNMTGVKILAMVIGFGGVLMVSVSDVVMALESTGVCVLQSKPSNISSVSNSSSNHTLPAVSVLVNVCTPFTKTQLVTSLFALVGGCLMWSVSSVFWRSKRGDIHFVVAGVWNNVFAGLYALAFWFAMQQYESTDKIHWDNKDGIVSIVFLTIMSGWIAAIIVNYMYKNVGPAATNRVLCLVPLFTWIEDWIFVREFKSLNDSTLVVTEIIGLVLVFAGLVTSSLEMESFQTSLQRPLLSPTMDEVEPNNPFEQGYHEPEDGATSEEEIENGRQSFTSPNPFPPLVEVKPSYK